MIYVLPEISNSMVQRYLKPITVPDLSMASHQAQPSMDDSDPATGTGDRGSAALAPQVLSSNELELLSPEVVLQRSLNVNSVISTSSSFARRRQQARNQADLQVYVDIGKGMQGAVFEKIGMPYALKKETPDTNTGRNLEEELRLHTLVYEAFAKYGSTVNTAVKVPRPYKLIKSDDKYWEENIFRFPPANQSPTTAVEMERILPLPKVLRKALISRFHPTPDPATVAQILDRTPDKHCLVRTYLGRRNRAKPLTDAEFSLRNFQLYLDPMKELSLDVTSLATWTGQAFAIMHWGSGIDGDDVEFVLGTSATDETDVVRPDLQHRAIGFYLLDFGQCQSVDLLESDVDEVYQRFKAAMIMGDNQLFIPHPKEVELFRAFAEAYKKTAELILMERGLDGKFDVDAFFQEYIEYTEDFLPSNY